MQHERVEQTKQTEIYLCFHGFHSLYSLFVPSETAPCKKSTLCIYCCYCQTNKHLHKFINLLNKMQQFTHCRILNIKLEAVFFKLQSVLQVSSVSPSSERRNMNHRPHPNHHHCNRYVSLIHTSYLSVTPVTA